MISYSNIVKSWLSYLLYEELSNLKIPAKDIEDYYFFYTDNNHNEHQVDTIYNRIVENENCLYFKVKDNLLNHLINHFSKYKNGKNDDIESYFLFPLLEIMEGKEKKYVPLFIIKLTTKKYEWVSSPYPYPKEYSFLNDPIKNPAIKIMNINDKVDYLICVPAFSKFLRFDSEDINEMYELSFQKPLSLFLRDFLRIKEEKLNFPFLIKSLKQWIQQRLKEINSRIKLSIADGIVYIDKEIIYGATRLIKKELEILQNPECDPRNKKTPADYYLYGKMTKEFFEYNKPSDKLWLGSFHNYPLSQGQGLILQKLLEGENLIAAQGPPGTGKTTVLMAVVANILTKRALNIAIGNENDFNSLILMTSTANKAVKNAKSDIIQDRLLKKHPLIKNGGFYLEKLKKEDGNIHIEQVNKFIEWLQKEAFDINAYNNAKNNLIRLYSHLQSKFEKIKILKQRKNDLVISIKEIRSHIIKSKNKLKEIETEIIEYKNELKSLDFNEKEIDDINNLSKILENYKSWVKQWKESNLSHFSLNLIKSLIGKKYEKILYECSFKLKNISFFQKIFQRKKVNTILSEITAELAELFSMLSIHPEKISSRKKIINCIHNEIWPIINSAKKLNECLLDKRLLYLENSDKIIDNYLNTAKRYKDEKNNFDNYNNKLKELRKKAADLKNNKFNKCLKKNFFELNNQRFYLRNRVLFFYSLDFLLQHIIKTKSDVIKSLRLFVSLQSGNYNAIDEIIHLGIENFYKNISLVYPYHFSTIHSSPYIFKHFSERYKNFIPIYLLIVDEAAMALPHLIFPALHKSKNVIVIGDPFQLPPVVPLDKNTIEIFHKEFYENDLQGQLRFSPVCSTVYHRTAKCETGNKNDIGQAVFLDVHRRCQEPIAKLFKKIANYSLLKIKTPNLKNEQKEKLEKINDGKNLLFINVQGAAGLKPKTNKAEAEKIKELLEKIKESGYLYEEIGIITPFVNQEMYLQSILPLKKDNIGTIHKFQGKEFPIIIFSPVVFRPDDPTNFIQGEPNLLNVAVSRAKELFIVVGSLDKLKSSGGYLKDIVEYCEKYGKLL